MARSNVFSVEPLIQLMKEVIQEEEEREILQANLIHMDYLLNHITTVLQEQLPEAARETPKVWLQLLHNCLAQAKSILNRSNSRQLCLDCLSNNSQRASKQVKNWKDVMEEEEKRHILQTEFRPLDDLLQHISAVFQDQQKSAAERLKIWLQLLHNSLTQANNILHGYGPSQRQRRQLDCLIGNRGRSPQPVKEWKVLFNYIFQGLQEEFSVFLSADQSIKRDPIISVMAEEELLQPLSKDEAWEMFRGLAFCNDNPIPVDIEECAKNIADECKSFRLAIILVASAMRGKSRADEWETSLSSIKNPDPASPDTLPPRIDAELYQRYFRWSYNALPNSDIRNCFLYCAMYPKHAEIQVQELVEMWIAEGLVRSQQKNYLVEMDIGLSYVDLLLNRRFFHYPADEEQTLGGVSTVSMYKSSRCYS